LTDTHFRSRNRARGLGALIALCALLPGGGALAKPPTKPNNTPKPKTTPAPASARLAYNFEAGKSYPYKVLLLLDGHIPGLSLSDGPPVHILADLTYVANVKKQDEKGTEISFSVEAAELGFLEKEVGPDGKIAADNEKIPYDIPLDQVRGMFNVTALLHPDGSIASVTGGSSPLRIEIGVDLRKLFIAAVLPVVFPQNALKTGDAWPFEEGALGRKPGTTTYTGHLIAIRPNPKATDFEVAQDAQTLIASKLDKEGNSTDNASQAVGTLDGKVTATGTMRFAAILPTKRTIADTTPLYAGRQAQGQLTLNIVLKKVMPDADHPDQKVVTPIDARGRLFVTVDSDVKPATDPKAAKPASTPASDSAKKGSK